MTDGDWRWLKLVSCNKTTAEIGVVRDRLRCPAER
jgi:hypothetical protein